MRKSIIVTAALCVCLAAPLSADLTVQSARKPAPDVTLRDASGTPVQLSTFKGKVVLLDFWATWCAGCKIEMPWFVEFQKAYRDQGLSTVGVAMDDEGWKTVTPYLKEHPVGYQILTGNNADIAKRYKIVGLPVTVLIDHAGKIAQEHVGVVDKTKFEIDLKRLLEEKRSR